MDAIDSHFHVFRQPRVAVPGSRYLPGYSSPFENWAAAAEAAGVRHGVVVQTSFQGVDNREILAELAREPGRLRGVAVVSEEVGAAELHALHHGGIRAIRLNLVGAPPQYLARLELPPEQLDAMLALGWHVEIQTDTGLLPTVLPRIDARLPVVLDYFGKPATGHAGDATFACVSQRLHAGSAPVYVKLAAPYRLAGLEPQGIAAAWLERLGLERLLWGSDWPCANYETQADYARLYGGLQHWLGDRVPAGELSRCVLWDNPRRLYWGEA